MHRSCDLTGDSPIVSYQGRPVRILHFETIDSTNMEQKRLGAPLGTVIIAKSQTMGRGRLGRRFSSRPGGLYISFAIEMDRTLTATAKAAVAVCASIERTFGIKPRIKWLNDLVIDGRKICGILAESCQGRIVMGIGVNVCTESFPDELNDTAASLFPDSRSCPPRALENLEESLIREFFHTMEPSMDKHCLQSYKNRLSTIGRSVNVIQAGQLAFTGIAAGITDDYHLIVKSEDGALHELGTGEVTIRNA